MLFCSRGHSLWSWKRCMITTMQHHDLAVSRTSFLTLSSLHFFFSLSPSLFHHHTHVSFLFPSFGFYCFKVLFLLLSWLTLFMAVEWEQYKQALCAQYSSPWKLYTKQKLAPMHLFCFCQCFPRVCVFVCVCAHTHTLHHTWLLLTCNVFRSKKIAFKMYNNFLNNFIWQWRRAGGKDSVTGFEIYSIIQVEADLHVNKKVRNLFII